MAQNERKTSAMLLQKILYFAIFCGLIGYFIIYLVYSFFALLYPYQLDYGEGLLLNQSMRLANGLPIYKSIYEYPFIVANYPPLYVSICAIFVRFLGNSMAVGRAVSIISTLITGFLIFLIVFRITKQTKSAIAAALFFFASPYIYKWSVLYRVDMLGLLFSFIGIYFILKSRDGNKSQFLYLGTIFFVMAFYTKQSFLAAPIAAFSYLFIKDKWLSIKMALVFLSIVVFVFLTLNHLTSGEFYKHLVLYNVNTFSFLAAIGCYIKFLQIHGLLVTLAAFYVLSRSKEQDILSLYFILSLIFALSVGKIGSNVNYFIEAIASSCLLFGLFFAEFDKKLEKGIYNENVLVFALIILQLLLFAHMPFIEVSDHYIESPQNMQKVSKYLSDVNDLIVSEDGGILIINGKTVWFEPFIFTQLSKQGLWDQSKFVEDISNKRFSLIVLEFDIACIETKSERWHKTRFTDEMLEAINRNYRLVDKAGIYHIYSPKK